MAAKATIAHRVGGMIGAARIHIKFDRQHLPFAFLRSNSAMELRRYMNRMILEFSRINTLEGVTRTPYNQYESIIVPMRAWLEGKGVEFVGNRKVTE